MSAPEPLAHVREAVGPDDIAFSVITVAELEHGVWRARNEGVGQRRREFVDDLLAAVPAYPLTTRIARRAGKIDGQSRQRGIVIPFADLLIGATALEFGYGVGSANLRHFQMIPGLEVKPL